jgi:hypothetical protein
MPGVGTDESELLDRDLARVASLMRVLLIARGLCLPDWLVFSGAVYQPGTKSSNAPLPQRKSSTLLALPMLRPPESGGTSLIGVTERLNIEPTNGRWYG